VVKPVDKRLDLFAAPSRCRLAAFPVKRQERKPIDDEPTVDLGGSHKLRGSRFRRR